MNSYIHYCAPYAVFHLYLTRLNENLAYKKKGDVEVSLQLLTALYEFWKLDPLNDFDM